jgi:hypothetical protein
MQPSPAPRRRSRAWLWLAGGLALLLLGGLATVLTAPRWAAPIVRDALVERLERRSGLPVTLDSVELSWGAAHITGLVIGDEPGAKVRLDSIAVTLDRDALWRGQAIARDITIEAGRVEGKREELEDLARRVIGRRDTDEPDDAGQGRVRIVPDTATMRDMWVVVSEPSGAERPRRLEAKLEITAVPAQKRAQVVLWDVRADPGKGPVVTARRLETTLQVRRHEGSVKVLFPLAIELEGVSAPINEQIAVAGVDGRVRLADAQLSEIAIDLAGTFGDAAENTPEPSTVSKDKLWEIAGTVRRDLSRGVLRLNMESFELGRIPEVLDRLPLVDSERATVGGHINVVFGAGIARVEGDVSVAGLHVEHRTLARSTVRDIGFSLRFAAALDPAARRIEIDHAAIERGGIELRMRGEVEHPRERRGRRYRLKAEIPPVGCQQVLAAVPAELAPSMQGFDLDGMFEANVVIDVNYADLDALILDGNIGIWNCKVRRAPDHAAIARLAGPFVHRVTMRDGRERVVRLVPGSGSFTSLEAISPYMQAAVLTTEDGGFYRHRGFLPSQFRTALHRNLEAGKIRLGASTISMQMVKNVLLSHERTLSRKLQEMFLTWYLETGLSKARIMEIYLNVVEFGPGIYGVTRAAEHYFGKYPRDLTLPEAAYLSLMLPSPVRRHVHYCKGGLNAAFEIKLQRIIRIMYERKRIDELDYELWKDTELVFDDRERGDVGACLAEINRLMEATQGQHAITGLLGDGEIPDEPLEVAKLPVPPPVDGSASVDAPGRPAMDDDDALDGEEPW